MALLAVLGVALLTWVAEGSALKKVAPPPAEATVRPFWYETF
jgi:hypothetical protein